MIDFELEFRHWLLDIKKVGNIVTNSHIEILKEIMFKLYGKIDWNTLRKDQDDLLFFYILTNRERYRQYFCVDTIIKNEKDVERFNKCLYYFNTIYIDKKTNFKQRNAFLAFYMNYFKTNKMYIDTFSKKKDEAIKFIERIILDNFDKYDLNEEDAALYLDCAIPDVKILLMTKKIKLNSESIKDYLNTIFCPSKYNTDVDFRLEEYYDINEAAELLGCTVNDIQQYMNERQIGYIRYSEKDVKIIKKDLLRLKNITLKEKI